MTRSNAINANSSGFQSVTSVGVWNGVTLTPTSNQTTVSNGDGTAGNPTIALTSTIYVSGISFDSGSNIMSAYSTGTFSPTFTFTTTPPTIAYSHQSGTYTKIGTRVFCNTNITVSSISGGAGNGTLASLPFTAANISNDNTINMCSLQTVTIGGKYMEATQLSNSTNCQYQSPRSATTLALLPPGDVVANSILRQSIIYEV